MLEIVVTRQVKISGFTNKKIIELAKVILLKEGIKKALISVALLDDKDIHAANKKFLDHDEPTDVITFPLDQAKNKLTGEILIGVGVARRHAKNARLLLEHELTLYLIHGLLHLCGFDDLNPVARKKMRKRERFHLSRLGLPDIAPLQ
ncbi:MAG: rRNA maturation RNase YbeY [Planctomycetes bacterium]|nr:rRNA maturation RNase YbeY [Planctomycetota bacterium]NBY00585.1 rRNA maturation RNase YbeY [Planctomycetota bacterium]